VVDKSLVDKIKLRGYWKVNIRPLKFEEGKIASLNALKKILSDCEVSFRGWPYPLIKEIYSDKNFIWGGVDWQNHIEYWRFYQSLQFIHFFSLREDWEDSVKSFFGGKMQNPRQPGSGLSVLGSLYTFAEIYEFTNRLVHKAPFENGVQIKIDLVGTENRKLFVNDPLMSIDDYFSRIPEITFERTYSLNDIMMNNVDSTLDCCIYFFERFNWQEIPIDFLKKRIE
jgi:hypothetical protein